MLNLNEAISLVVVKSNDEISWPEKLSLTPSNQVDSEVVELLATTEKSSTRRHYKGKGTSTFKGDVLAQLTNFFFWTSTTDTSGFCMAVYADRSYSIWKTPLAFT
ncbi:MAG: hypothetical protein OR997_03405 [Methylophilaceae bacterium]|nr:hypothetical protein [Methylophilaceae bacterium]